MLLFTDLTDHRPTNTPKQQIRTRRSLRMTDNIYATFMANKRDRNEMFVILKRYDDLCRKNVIKVTKHNVVYKDCTDLLSGSTKQRPSSTPFIKKFTKVTKNGNLIPVHKFVLNRSRDDVMSSTSSLPSPTPSETTETITDNTEIISGYSDTSKKDSVKDKAVDRHVLTPQEIYKVNTNMTKNWNLSGSLLRLNFEETKTIVSVGSSIKSSSSTLSRIKSLFSSFSDRKSISASLSCPMDEKSSHRRTDITRYFNLRRKKKKKSRSSGAPVQYVFTDPNLKKNLKNDVDFEDLVASCFELNTRTPLLRSSALLRSPNYL